MSWQAGLQDLAGQEFQPADAGRPTPQGRLLSWSDSRALARARKTTCQIPSESKPLGTGAI
jgi:hypothetical protein